MGESSHQRGQAVGVVVSMGGGQQGALARVAVARAVVAWEATPVEAAMVAELVVARAAAAREVTVREGAKAAERVAAAVAETVRVVG